MVYSRSLADRVRAQTQTLRGITEKRMFGGLVFMLYGNMLVGIWQNSLIVRLGPEQAPAALKQPNVREFDVTGRPMKGWIMVDPDGLESDRELKAWLERAAEFVSTLPPK